MKCVYFYKNQLLGDELLMTDFLLTKLKYYPNLGDLVFDAEFSHIKAKHEQIIDLKLMPIKDETIKRLKAWTRRKKSYSEDGIEIPIEESRPFIGVNKYLGLYVRENDKRLEPAFEEENYWANVIDKWKPTFNPDGTISRSGEMDLDLIDLLGEAGFTVDLNKVQSDDTYKLWREEITKKWKFQAELGSAIHAISLFMFSKENGRYWFELVEDNEAELQRLYTTYNSYADEYNVKVADALDPDPVKRFEQFKQGVDMIQQFRKEMQAKYGENCSFYPELGITAHATKEIDGSANLFGIIDLLVIDSRGNPHIFDYKTSPKHYSQYNDAKKRSFKYQLAVYDRMLQTYGINTYYGSASIVPIKLNGIRLSNGHYVYDSISYEVRTQSINEVTGKYSKVEVQNITKDIKSPDVLQDIDEFMPLGNVTSATSENLIEKVLQRMKREFPDHFQYKGMSDEEINTMLEEQHCYDVDQSGNYVFRPNQHVAPIELSANEPDAKEKFFEKVKHYIETINNTKENIAASFIDAWKTAKETGDVFEFSKSKITGADSIMLQNFMRRYCNDLYELVDIPELIPFGMVILKNTKTKNTLHVFKLTTDRVDKTIKFGNKRTNLNGAFVTDVVENSKINTRILKATSGNIEAMEVMHILNNLDFNENQVVVAEVNVINPYFQQRLPISNKELLYNFQNLDSLESQKYNETFPNKFKDGAIKLIEPSEMIRLRFDEIMQTEPQELRKFTRYLGQSGFNWQESITKDELYRQLNILRRELESEYLELANIKRTSTDLMNPVNLLYSEILDAMLFLKGEDVRQQLKDLDNYIETFKNILTEGHEGLNIENPGNFRSHVLNRLTESVKTVYQNAADQLNHRNIKLQELIADLKREKNFGWILDTVTGNQTNLYQNLFRVVGDDLWFKRVDDPTLSNAERNLLEFVLDIVNKDRHSTNTANLTRWKELDAEEYYRVPVLRASAASKVSSVGLKEHLKNVFSQFNPKTIKEKAQGLIEDSPEYTFRKHKMYEVANMFQAGEGDSRQDYINALGGVNALERNVEELFLMHSFQYLLLDGMEQEMPIIKASALALANMGSQVNLETGNFDNLIEFIEHYVTNKINGEPIDDARFKALQKPIGMIRLASSLLAMAFNPVQFTYQRLEGVWKDIALIIKKPDGTNAFSRRNMIKSFVQVEKNINHYSSIPSIDELINRAYRINDMDSRQFAQHISSNKGIMTHIQDFAFRFATRADFYNRMVIFEALMREHGSFDAHVVENGHLVYKWELDLRFAAYAQALKMNKPMSQFNEEERQAYSNYLSTANQLIAENVTNDDGTLFTLGQPLPRAYSNKEASAMKAIGDNLYGYYNHEDKSMFNSMFIGGLYMQMKTYWSAKKNQYFAPGGVKQMGKWVDYIEDGKLMYYAKKEDGTIDLEAGFVTEDDPRCSMVKVQQWLGQWQEGIIVTLANFISSARASNRGDKTIGEVWREQWNNPDPNLRTSFRSNISHLLCDLFIMSVFGGLCTGLLKGWDDEEQKKARKSPEDMGQAIESTMAHILYKTFKNSTLDANPFDSIGSGVVDWLPFSFAYVGKVAGNTWDFLTGEKNFVNATGSSIAVINTTKPIWRTLTYSE